ARSYCTRNNCWFSVFAQNVLVPGPKAIPNCAKGLFGARLVTVIKFGRKNEPDESMVNRQTTLVLAPGAVRICVSRPEPRRTRLSPQRKPAGPKAPGSPEYISVAVAPGLSSFQRLSV